VNKLWKAVIICVGIVVAVVLYLRSQNTLKNTEKESIAIEEEVPGENGTEISSGQADGGAGFTETQKAELRAMLEEALEGACGNTVETSVRTALENCLKQMTEDGRLEAAVTSYAGVQSSLINVNTAGQEELIRLNGIGEAKARAIIAYREEHGPFQDISELVNVSGISNATLEKFRDQVTL